MSKETDRPMPPDYRFIESPDDAAEALRALSGEPEIALDLEADSLHSYREKVCLVQVSTASANMIIDPLSCRGALSRLQDLLEDEAILKVLHGGDYDVRLLKKDLGFAIRNVFDTMTAAQLSGRPKHGLAALLEEEFGVRLDKKHQQANWAQRPLSADLLAYAACDTAWLIPLKSRLERDLDGLGRLSWAREEFRLLEGVEPAAEREPSAAGVKGARTLSPAQRAYLKRLLDLREEAASQKNRPPFKVLSNQVLLSWAQRPPSSRREVIDTPGASKGILASLAPAVLEAFARALTPEECAAPPKTNGTPLTACQKKTLQRLKEVRARLEGALRLPPGLLVNSATLERMARVEAGGAGDFFARELKAWQREAAGGELRAVLEEEG